MCCGAIVDLLPNLPYTKKSWCLKLSLRKQASYLNLSEYSESTYLSLNLTIDFPTIYRL